MATVGKIGLAVIAAGVLIVLGLYFAIGDHIHNQAAHNSKVLCSAKFVSNRDLAEAVRNSIRVSFPGDSYRIDGQSVVYTSLGIARRSVYLGDQGCSALPKKLDEPLFRSRSVEAAPAAIPLVRRNNSNLQADVDTLFAETGAHNAVLVIQNGEVVAERYKDGFTANTKFESWSMGKSLTATLIGRLIQQDRLSLYQRAPIDEWAGDERATITIANLLNMSSGLRFSQVPRKTDGSMDTLKMLRGPVPDHIAVYSGIEDVFAYSIASPLEFEPNTVRRYRNCDPLTLGAVLRRTVEAAGEDYWQWPQKNLFDKLGTDGFVLETDARGNFILTGFDYGTADAWARLGLLYLQEGEWNGERLLPASFVDFVREPASAEENSEYGGQFWLNTRKRFALPDDAYAMSGDGGQHVIIVPSLNAVIVRFGHVNTPRYRDSVDDLLTLIVGHIAAN
ncbi:MAG: serine hydrolase [Pseudomonadota bacterium]